jgi:cytochrome c oxidase assembly factor CtaG
MPRKRSHSEMATSEPPQVQKEQSTLHKIRNMWEFASVMQYIYIFGKVVKVDEDFDIEVRNTSFPNAKCALRICGGVVWMIGMANLPLAGL